MMVMMISSDGAARRRVCDQLQGRHHRCAQVSFLAMINAFKVFKNRHFASDLIPKPQLFLLKVRSWRELWSTEEQSQEGNFDDSHQGDHYFHVMSWY